MELIVIGEYGPYPKGGAAASSYLIRSGTNEVILDMGSGTLSKMQKHLAFDEADAVILSHLHFDHFCDLLPYSYFFSTNKKKLKVYCPKTPEVNFELIKSCAGFEVEAIDGDSKVTVRNLTFTFKQMTHPVESYAIKCVEDNGEALVYSGDTTFNDDIIPFIKGAKLAVLDCGNFACVPESPHLTLEEASKIATETGAKIIASHLNPFGKYQKPPANVKFARSGRKYMV